MNFFHFVVKLHNYNFPDFLFLLPFLEKKKSTFGNILTSVYLASKEDGTL